MKKKKVGNKAKILSPKPLISGSFPTSFRAHLAAGSHTSHHEPLIFHLSPKCHKKLFGQRVISYVERKRERTFKVINKIKIMSVQKIYCGMMKIEQQT